MNTTFREFSLLSSSGTGCHYTYRFILFILFFEAVAIVGIKLLNINTVR